MSPEDVLTIFQHALQILLMLILVLLIPALVIGLMVSMFQAATQINEMTLSFIPKLIITVITLMFAGPWMLRLIMDYTQQLIQDIPYIVG
ncbi:MAG: flagellar biosynthesis protein FliQ [Gammaproteobacteria bacterium]|nr:flagellar biosynthesis protein FliQ [Gammaproteobacteria bacterium]MDH5660025.1 flagellar biosynthesis protein FliQ [Gammaproteobacteria bacterium]